MKYISSVINSMIEYYAGDAARIQHFLKVYAFAKTIGEMENATDEVQELLEVAAVIHDIGIKISEEKYQSAAGNYQQVEGPPIAKAMLLKLGYDEEFIERTCYLIAHHHTYDNIEGLDYQILVEADFLVNISEEQMTEQQIQMIKQKIFRTDTGLAFLKRMYEHEVLA